MSLGKILKQYRSEKQMTLRELAKITELSPAIISRYENDRTTPSPENLQKLTECLGIPNEAVSSSRQVVEGQDIIINSTEYAQAIGRASRFGHYIFEYVDGYTTSIEIRTISNTEESKIDNFVRVAPLVRDALIEFFDEHEQEIKDRIKEKFVENLNRLNKLFD